MRYELQTPTQINDWPSIVDGILVIVPVFLEQPTSNNYIIGIVFHCNNENSALIHARSATAGYTPGMA